MSNDTVHRSDFSPTRPRRPRIVAAAYRVGLKTSPCSRVRSRGPSRVRSVFRFRAGFRFVELARRPGPSPSAGRAAPRPERLRGRLSRTFVEKSYNDRKYPKT